MSTGTKDAFKKIENANFIGGSATNNIGSDTSVVDIFGTTTAWSVVDDQILQLQCEENAANTDVFDSSGSPVNDGTLEGGDNTSDISQASGKIGRDFVLDGLVDRINVNSVVGDVLVIKSVMISLWVNPVDATPATTAELITFGDTDANTTLAISMRPGGELGVLCRIAGATQWILETDASVFSDGVSTHVLMLHDGNQATLYVGGVAVAQIFLTDFNRAALFIDLPGLDNCRIGCLNFNNNGDILFFDGDIDDVRIITRVTNVNERTGIINGGAGTHDSSGTVLTGGLSNQTFAQTFRNSLIHDYHLLQEVASGGVDGGFDIGSDIFGSGLATTPDDWDNGHVAEFFNVDIEDTEFDLNFGDVWDIGCFASALPSVSDIKPGGGGAFADLATWETAVDGLAAGQWAKCFTGGSLGNVTLADWDIAPDRARHGRIFVADGEGHGGSLSAGAVMTGTATIALDLVAPTSDLIMHGYFEIDGLRITMTTGSFGIRIVTAASFITVSNCVIHSSTGTLQTFLTWSPENLGSDSDVIEGVVFRNNLLVTNFTGSGNLALVGLATDVGGANRRGIYSIEIYNNTVAGRFSDECLDLAFTHSGVGTVVGNAIVRNNVLVSANTPSNGDVNIVTTGATLNLTASNNETSDGEADSELGGTGNNINVDYTTEFTDETVNDFTLASAAVAAGAGLFNKNVECLFIRDLANNFYDSSALDMGAFAFSASSASGAFTITVDGNPVNDGDTTPVDIGTVTVDPDATPPLTTKTFVVENTGDSPTEITSVDLPTGFVFDSSSDITNFPIIINPAEILNFGIGVDPTTVGDFSGTVELFSVDAPGGSFTWAIEGSVVEAVEGVEYFIGMGMGVGTG